MSSPTPGTTRPDKHGDADHRLRSSTVVLIIVAAIIVAVGATAAVVLTGPAPVDEPPAKIDLNPKPRASGSITVIPSSAPKPTGMQGFTGGTGPAPQRPPLGDLPLASFEFGNGLPLDIPAGWSIIDKNANEIVLGHDDKNSIVYIVAGTVKSRDVKKVLSADIKQQTKDLNNVELDGDPEVKALNGKNFQQVAIVRYRGDASTQQGTLSLQGLFIELFNPTTGLAAFMDYSAVDEDALKAHADDVDAMIGSML